MPSFMYQLSDIDVFLILIAFTVAVSILFILINKLFIFRRLRYKDNATITSISALIGIIYGVLVGFLCLYLITNQDHASQAVQNEANALANIFNQSSQLQQPYKNNFNQTLQEYINEVVNHEWTDMNNFKQINFKGDYIILAMLKNLKNYQKSNPADSIVISDLNSSIKDLYSARHDRISLSYSALSPELWEVIVLGTILLIAINYAFRVNFYLHLFGTFTFAIMAASMLFLLVTLDSPFRGEFAVTADPIKSVLAFMRELDSKSNQ